MKNIVLHCEPSMNPLTQAESLLAKMSNTEKVHLLKRTLRDLSGTFPGVESHRRICGGETCIKGTRIPVWELEQARRRGVSESDMLKTYSVLCAEDLINAWNYVRFHQREIEEQLRANNALEPIERWRK